MLDKMLLPASCFTNLWLFLCVCSITYNGSMESPVPLYPTDCPPPYEAVIGQRDPSQVNAYKEISGLVGMGCGLLAVFTMRLSLYLILSVCSLLMLVMLLLREEPLWVLVVKVFNFMFTSSMQCHCVLYVSLYLCLSLTQIHVFLPVWSVLISLLQCQATVALCWCLKL